MTDQVIMSIAWLLKILSPHLQNVFPMLLVTVHESWVKILFLLCYVMLIYESVQSSALGLFTTVFEKFRNFKYLWNVYINMVILLQGASLCLHVVQVLFRVKQLFKSITWKSTPRLENYEWLGVGVV